MLLVALGPGVVYVRGYWASRVVGGCRSKR